MANIINSINRKFVNISNRLIPKYEEVLGMPIFNSYKESTQYRDVKIFGPHQSPTYPKRPDVTNKLFYIPYLLKKEGMNSSELEFDAFYTENDLDRPFIETTKKNDLPLQTKVVVHLGSSIRKFFIDKKTVVNGSDGHILLRMYLSPLAKDTDEENIDQEEFIPSEEENLYGGMSMNIPDED